MPRWLLGILRSLDKEAQSPRGTFPALVLVVQSQYPKGVVSSPRVKALALVVRETNHGTCRIMKILLLLIITLMIVLEVASVFCVIPPVHIRGPHDERNRCFTCLFFRYSSLSHEVQGFTQHTTEICSGLTSCIIILSLQDSVPPFLFFSIITRRKIGDLYFGNNRSIIEIMKEADETQHNTEMTRSWSNYENIFFYINELRQPYGFSSKERKKKSGLDLTPLPPLPPCIWTILTRDVDKVS